MDPVNPPLHYQIVMQAGVASDGEVDYLMINNFAGIDQNHLRKIWLKGCEMMGIKVDEPRKIKFREFL